MAFLPNVAAAPDDTFTPPKWFLAELTTLANTAVATPRPPPFCLKVSTSAAEHDARLFPAADGNPQVLLDAFQDMTLAYGSEFRHPNKLRPLLGLHRHVELLNDLLTGRMPYRYETDLYERDAVEERIAILSRGNHKSATAEAE